jgi:hypothetical protein
MSRQLARARLPTAGQREPNSLLESAAGCGAGSAVPVFLETLTQVINEPNVMLHRTMERVIETQ